MIVPCSKCGTNFDKDEWLLSRICKPCKNKKQREYRKLGKNGCTKKYEKSITGYLMRMYRNMRSRIEGVQTQKWHLYKGKYLLPKREFYLFALRNSQFVKLYKEYKKQKYPMRLAPSVNRVDSKRGYEIENIEFVTQSENSRLGSLSCYQRIRS